MKNIFLIIIIYLLPPCAVTFSWWGIVYVSDPDNYADWSF